MEHVAMHMPGVIVLTQLRWWMAHSVQVIRLEDLVSGGGNGDKEGTATKLQLAYNTKGMLHAEPQFKPHCT